VLAALIGCQKASDNNVTISANLKKAFSFQPGTYWIYRDSLSGMIDSFYVTDNTSSTTQVGNSNYIPTKTIYTDHIYIGISQMNIAPLPSNSVIHKWEFHLYENNFSVYWLDTFGSYGHYYGDPLTSLPFPDTALVYKSYTLNGNSFKNVAVAYKGAHWAIDTVYSFDDYLYVCPNVGLIKLRMSHYHDNMPKIDSYFRVWELQRYKVKQ
jgi:hypothetical protein